MGKPILIYHDGQRYEIDSDHIYIPYFIAGRRSGKANMAMDALRQAKENGLTTLVLGDKNETNKILPVDTSE